MACPDAATEGFANEWGEAVGWPVIDSDEDVAFADAGALAGGVERNMFRSEAALSFNPPDAVGRDVEATLALEVHRSKHACNHSR